VSATTGERRHFDSVPESARAARDFVTHVLNAHHAPSAVIGDFQLVVSELASNVIERGDVAGLELIIDATHPDWWQIEIIGGQASFDHRVMRPDEWVVSGAEQDGGRGLGIVRMLMETIDVTLANGLVHVRCRRVRLAQA
jgi:anti-sigma regulatory factor (Ser/Thr protein kinase)